MVKNRLISHMQQGALSSVDSGPDDHVAGPAKPIRPGEGAPYAQYHLGAAYYEIFNAKGNVRPHYAGLDLRLLTLSSEELARRQHACEQSFLHQGITFTVYSDNQSTER